MGVFRAGGLNPLKPSTNFWRLESWGGDGTTPYFEGARFISKVFSSWFDDMFEKIWILLKFWPFLAPGPRLVAGDKIAISTSPPPLFLGFWWVRHPPPYFGGGGSIFEGFGVWYDGMLRLFPPFFSLLHVLGAW